MICIHTNIHLPHQVEFAEYLLSGFKKHNQDAIITTSIEQEADIHVVLGPHYAKKHWLGHPNTILLDRAYWGDPINVSLGWMNEKGGRNFQKACPGDRPKPTLQPWKNGNRYLFLMDYCDSKQDFVALQSHIAEQSGEAVKIRLHPVACNADQGPLERDLERYDIAVGRRTTALVDAAIAGLAVVCVDDQNIVWDVSSHSYEAPLFKGDRAQWLNNVSYANWSGEEIASGEAWEYLCQLR